MSYPRLKLAFGCQSRVGKDTACDYLVKEYGGNVHRLAGPIYHLMEYAQEYLGLKKEKDTRFLQIIGTEWGRHKDENIWINAVLNQIGPDVKYAPVHDNKKIMLRSPNAFIPDLRFKNEFEGLRKAGFTLIRVIRGNRPVDRNMVHQSEIDLLDEEWIAQHGGWDHVITNDGTMEEFYQKIESIIANLRE